MSTVEPWPNPSEVFALTIGGRHLPLILIAIMTFILISSSGTMAMAVNFGYRRDRAKTAVLMLVTAALGATFVGMQAFEWTKLIMEGVRPWGNPWGAAQFGSSIFMITAAHGLHLMGGLVALGRTTAKVWRGAEMAQVRLSVELCTIYWHFLLFIWLAIFVLLAGWAANFVNICRQLLT
jgi:cytochrome c oxidase subunit 3